MKSLFILLLIIVPIFAAPTVVCSDKARYDGEKIILEGHVHVEHEMGELFAAFATLIRDENKTTKLDFPWIKLEKEVRFCLQKERELTCLFASCDYTQKKAFIEGGLCYSDQHGKLYAKRAVIDYVDDENGLRPTKVTLLGEVQMKSSKRAQYALADQVDYYPDQELMVMTAKNRVLFYDSERNMELAAREVRAKRDDDGHESVQGIGHVRFVFSADELNRLRSIDAKN